MKETLFAILIPAGLAAVTAFYMRRRNSAPDPKIIKPGAICTVNDGQGAFGVVKVLAKDKRNVHILLYANRWENRPSLAEIEQVDLHMGCVRDNNTELARHHLPLSHEAFADWKPVVIKYARIFRFEREGYEQWKELGGEVFLW